MENSLTSVHKFNAINSYLRQILIKVLLIFMWENVLKLYVMHLSMLSPWGEAGHTKGDLMLQVCPW